MANKVSYSRDYITRLAREGKILATHVGRQWFVDLDSLNNYIDTTAKETEVRKRCLAKKERGANNRYSCSKEKDIQTRKAKTLNARATVAACAVLSIGLFEWLGDT